MTENPANAIAAVDRAIGELRRGQAVAVWLGERAVLLVAAEYADAKRLEPLHTLLLTPERARHAGIPEATAPIAVTLPAKRDDETSAQVLALAVPQPGVKATTSWPVAPAPEDVAPVFQLLRLAELLPGALVVELPVAALPALHAWAVEHDILTVTAAAVQAYPEALAESLAHVSTAQVPLHGLGTVSLLMFRPAQGGYEHMAVVVGDVAAADATPLVRVHSSCLTGDVLGSLRCDCGDQLRQALQAITQSGCGVVVYVNQEGRGIGLANKLRTYGLQDHGLDTMEANEALGFGGDEREFLMAGAMLKLLGVKRLKLLTNNPKKVRELAALGVEVVERVPVIAGPNGVNDGYLATKAEKAGHMF